MIELFEKVFLTGLGVVSLSQKKVEECLVDLKEKYKVGEDEGKAILEKIQTMAKDVRERIEEMADVEVKRAIDRLGLVPREEYDRLAKRVEALEAKAGIGDPSTEC
ncbi:MULTISPECIES: phasin family protein [Geobacter]|uniref:Phasin superfamily protein n=2 Tax=Geobacter TaxID=28231 RepID=A0A0C1TTR6_9BACT|nr:MULTISPECIES: phasin family protein [Geobacter]ANA40776.1 phasin superfamily protein [Geobacter anodireducens]KIE42853.1 phasin superfamily protein [Geobacter soli]MBE2889387.1 phasin family protein [Geobacter anodireducens]HMN01950.1 phasin family protein [Geobacter anodireducens]